VLDTGESSARIRSPTETRFSHKKNSGMKAVDFLQRPVCETIDAHRAEIVDIGEAIMDAPELGFKERQAVDRVKEVFRRTGLPYEDGLALTVFDSSLI